MQHGAQALQGRAQAPPGGTDLDPKLFEAWHNLGIIETALGHFDEAEEDFKRALDCSPARARRCSPRARASGAPTNRGKAAKVYAQLAPPIPTTSRCALVTARCCARRATDESLEQVRLLLASR